MIEFTVLGNRRVDDPLWEVIRTDVPTNGNGVPSECLNFLSDKLSFLFVQTAEVDISIGLRDGEHGINILANHNLRALPGENDRSAPSNSLSRTGQVSLCARDVRAELVDLGST